MLVDSVLWGTRLDDSFGPWKPSMEAGDSLWWD